MRRITISRSELQSAYENMTSKEAANHFGVCLQKFYNILDEAGIERKRKNFKRGESISVELVK